jgi:hypothetical protein
MSPITGARKSSAFIRLHRQSGSILCHSTQKYRVMLNQIFLNDRETILDCVRARRRVSAKKEAWEEVMTRTSSKRNHDGSKSLRKKSVSRKTLVNGIGKARNGSAIGNKNVMKEKPRRFNE